ncbi:FtsB family cell division protein [Macrococcus equipercicus]|uniref:Septum formation initiator family protein n=1 Tax=Macrococcus equipercicus TaxID=69967 RepID=A0A9Q9BQP9_9STAP|nr:septum formation initiator family protein [Macrococcus equipercicus]KAA1036170.1 septum formation initiator family protein [Macrococcus equipercicus]UTH13729.1 septum formation initiator family protein [Macrococcus equipercicus]
MARKVKRMNNDYTKQNRIKVKSSRVVRKRLTVFGGALLAILLFLTVLLVTQMKQNSELKAAHDAKTAELAQLQDREIALKEKLKQLNNKEYITKIARSEYFLSNDGEIIFKIPDDQAKKKADRN